MLSAKRRRATVAAAQISYRRGNRIAQTVSLIWEARLDQGSFARRDVLKLMTAAGAAGLPAAHTLGPDAAHAAGAGAYDPAARFELTVSEVEMRRNSAGRMLMARIYQPK